MGSRALLLWTLLLVQQVLGQHGLYDWQVQGVVLTSVSVREGVPPGLAYILASASTAQVAAQPSRRRLYDATDDCLKNTVNVHTKTIPANTTVALTFNATAALTCMVQTVVSILQLLSHLVASPLAPSLTLSGCADWQHLWSHSPECSRS